MKAVRQIFKDVLLIELDNQRDDRGYICTRYSEEDFSDLKIDGIYVEEKIYNPIKKASMFGIYYQEEPYAQNKIIHCEAGTILVYIIDLDKNSENYKKWICLELNEFDNKQLFIPTNYAYGFLSLEDNCRICVKTDEYSTDGYFKYISYLDKNIGLEFPYDEIISTYKEKHAPTLREE